MISLMDCWNFWSQFLSSSIFWLPLNATNPDFVAESDLYSKTAELLKFLDSWSSSANTLPERITDLWTALYERDYIYLDDVEAVKDWLRVLQTVGYQYPTVHNNEISTASPNQGTVNNNKTPLTAFPQIQPSFEGQPYRSLPFFHAPTTNATNAEYERPESAIVKLIMMTMDEWPLLKSWVLVSSLKGQANPLPSASSSKYCSLLLFIS